MFEPYTTYWLQLRLPSVFLSRRYQSDSSKMERATADCSFAFQLQQIQRNDIGKLLAVRDVVDPNSHKFHDI